MTLCPRCLRFADPLLLSPLSLSPLFPNLRSLSRPLLFFFLFFVGDHTRARATYLDAFHDYTNTKGKSNSFPHPTIIKSWNRILPYCSLSQITARPVSFRGFQQPRRIRIYRETNFGIGNAFLSQLIDARFHSLS